MKSTTLMLAYCMLGVTGAYGQGDKHSVITAQDSALTPSVFNKPPSSITLFTRRSLQLLPSRSLTDLLLLSPTTVELNQNVHIRGSRANTTEYRVNGISVLDRSRNISIFPFIPEALEEVRIIDGVSTPDAGSAGGGVVEMKMREGGGEWDVTARYFTDDFAKRGTTFLKTFSYGTHTGVMTASGPLPFDLRMFVTGEVSRSRNRRPHYIGGFRYDSLVNARYYQRAGENLPGPVELFENDLPASEEERTTIQWNISTDLLGVHMNVLGSYGTARYKETSIYNAVRENLRVHRIPWIVDRHTMISGIARTTPLSWLTLQGSISYAGNGETTDDPVFGDEWWKYPDSAENTARGYTGFTARYYAPPSHAIIDGFVIEDPNKPNLAFRRSHTSTIRMNGSVSASITSSWTASAGWENEWSTMRFLGIRDAAWVKWTVDQNWDGIDEIVFADRDMDLYTVRRNASASTLYGYSYDGSELNDGWFAARRPASSALWGTVQYSDDGVLLDAGVRSQSFQLDMPFIDRTKLADGSIQGSLDYSTNILDPSVISGSPKVSYLLPRVRFAYASTDFSMYLAGGSFVDVHPLNALYHDIVELSEVGRWLSRYPLGSIQGWAGYTGRAMPQRTTQIDGGASIRLTSRVSVHAKLYRKVFTEQLQLDSLSLDNSAWKFVGLANNGEGTAVGAVVGASYSVPSWIVSVEYAWSSAQGSTSDPVGNKTAYLSSSKTRPDLWFPFDYLSEHRIVFQLEYAAPPTSIIHGFSVRTSTQASSGHPYTRQKGGRTTSGAIGQWFAGAIPVFYPQYSDPIEPFQTSRTPWTSVTDLAVRYTVDLDLLSVTFRADVLNLFDRKNEINVHSVTGSASSDGWLSMPGSFSYQSSYSLYEPFYRDINERNSYAYTYATGNYMYGRPRQIRFGVEVEL